MKKQFKLGVIGCGISTLNLIKGAVLSEFLHEKKIVVSVSSESHADELSYLGVRITDDNKYVAENCDFLLLGVKQQDFEETVKSLGNFKPDKIITVMLGVKKNAIKNAFGVNAVRVCRGVLNLPCSIGSGVIGVDMTDFNISRDDTEFLSNLFNCIGTVLSVDESKLDAVTSLGSAGRVFMYIDSIVSAGVNQGLTKNEAKIVAVQTLIGAAEMVEREECSLSELIMMSNRGSAAIEEVKDLESKNFRTIVSDAVSIHTKKLKELS